jgi:hypothetical protein
VFGDVPASSFPNIKRISVLLERRPNDEFVKLFVNTPSIYMDNTPVLELYVTAT